MRRLIPVSTHAVFAFLVLLIFFVTSGTSHAQKNGATPWGTWQLMADISSLTGIPGSTLSALVTIHQDGTVSVSDGPMFGGVPGATEVSSPGNGIWTRTGNTFTSTVLAFRYDKSTGILLGFSRSRTSLHFSDTFAQAEGMLWSETLNCAAPVFCPNATDPLAVWTPELNPNGLPFTAVRLRMVPPGPLS